MRRHAHTNSRQDARRASESSHDLVIGDDHGFSRHRFTGIPTAWHPFSVTFGAPGNLAIGCVYADDKFGTAFVGEDGRATALVQGGDSVAPEGWVPFSWSPDGEALLLRTTGPLLAVCTPESLPEAWLAAEELPGDRRTQPGSWAKGGVAESASAEPMPLTVLPPDTGRGRRANRGGFSLSDGTEERLAEYAGTALVQIRRADNPAGALAALAAARRDLYFLGTDPADEGNEAIPNLVSGPVDDPDGPWVVIDANDTEPELMQRIPRLLEPHLRGHGVKSAEIHVCDPWPGAFDRLRAP